MKTIDAARGRWFGILKGFGIDENYLRNVHGPCPICGGSDRWRWDDKDGNGTYYCNQCGSGNGIDLLINFTGRDFKEIAKEIDGMVNNIPLVTPKPKRDPLPRLRKLSESLEEVGQSPVRAYLRGRGLPVSKALRYHPRVDYWDQGRRVGFYPAMIAPFTAADGSFSTYHITHLTTAGQKANVPSVKKIMPPCNPMAGGAIRLTGIYQRIGICEGIETALAVMRDYKIPCWASTSATLLESFDPPEGVNQVVVFADRDRSYTGQKSAYTLANRLTLGGYQVTVEIPEKEDFAA